MHHDIVGAGPDLVLLHGWAMHAGVFAPLVDRLSSQFTLHLLDLPGHGRSAGAGVPLDLDAAARAAADVVPGGAIWLGWSLGGLVALHAVASGAANARGLVMLAASPRFVRADDWPAGMDPEVFAGFARHLAADWRGTVDRFLALEVHGSEHVREELRMLRATVFAHGEPAPGALSDGLAVLAGSDLRAELPALAVPSLWIAGRRDRVVHPEAMHAAAAAVPGGRFVEVERAGHAPFLTHADVVADAIADFAADCR
ncbi:pimeloyl-ACP methyl ester esterase BioH [Arenimonas composti]|uniref:pimeloyl-ACP methyl ester esterase BioH n=1 Tax=Arenimonas composti TaxID=370776 RepID=UPI0004797421|nr:pimeloyl-ACP methyl ester esterase BioH [Arenimonas composti]